MAPFKPLPPVEYIRELLDYDPETGEFRWKVWRTKWNPAGSRAGTVAHNGYVAISVGGQKCFGHRVAWALATGQDPGEKHVDHINGDRADNRLCNLRLATASQNMWNSAGWSGRRSSGHKGVRLVASTGRWKARIMAHRKERHLGYYDTAEEAHAAYIAAAKELHGEFARAA